MTIPAGLPNQFVNWRTEDGRKVPCRPDGRKCDHTDPANHLDYATAAAAPYDVAFVLTADDGWFFLDLDKCTTDDGNWTKDALDIWSYFSGAWGEVSQSGRGLHIMGRCDASQLRDRRNKWNGWLEFYTQDRFIAFGPTGWQPIGGTAIEHDWTRELLAFVPQREHLGDLPDGREPTYTGPEDDDQLIEMMLRTQNVASQFGEGVTVKDLWEANVAKLAQKYPAYDEKQDFDHSSADAALLSHLAFWTGRDMPRMDRLFRRSALMRDKWEKRADYRRDSVGNAARLCKKWYDKPVVPTGDTAGPTGHENYLTVYEMMSFFAGCTYIVDSHRVLIPDGRMLKPEQFKAVYGGHTFQMEPASKKTSSNAFEAFTENRCVRFPIADSTCFYPDRPFGEIIDGAVNIYVPPQVKAEPGDLTLWWEWMTKLLPDPDELSMLMSWCRFVVQNPGKKALWSPGLIGSEGNGKSLIWDIMRYAVGQKYSHKVKAEQLGTQFNDFMVNKVLVTSDEVYLPNKRGVMEIIKPYITDYMQPIRAMRQSETNYHCPCNWAFSTNYPDAFVISDSNRRYCVLLTAQRTLADVQRDFPPEFLQRFFHWLNNEGGREAIAYDLMHTQPDSRYDPNNGCVHAPDTSFTAKLKEMSRGGAEQEILEAVGGEVVGFRGGYVSSWHLEEVLRKSGINLQRGKRGLILESLGWQYVGRSSRAVIRENGTRPHIWYRGDDPHPSTDKYLQAQGAGYQ